MNIPIARTVFTDAELAAVLEPLKSGWVVQGPKVKEFEERWSSFTGARHSIAVSNCTTGLHLSLAALGIGPGDEVIVPAFTWVATANVVEAVGAKPVFCDIDLHTFNISVSQLEAVLTPATRALIPVHLFGLAAAMDEIAEIARRRKLFVIEDAACGFGARYRGTHVGRFGETGCFSFHPRKAITTGEGGMITTEDDALATKLRAMRDHGAVVSDHQRHLGPKPYLLPEFPYLGFNFRMTDIQGAIGATQLARAEEIFEQRTYWAGRYDEALASISWLRRPARPEAMMHGMQAYVCLFEPATALENIPETNQRRNAFMEHLQQQGVSTRPGTHAVHLLQYYREKYHLRPEHCRNAWAADHCSIAFPLFPGMTDKEFAHVINAICSFEVR